MAFRSVLYVIDSSQLANLVDSCEWFVKGNFHRTKGVLSIYQLILLFFLSACALIIIIFETQFLGGCSQTGLV